MVYEENILLSGEDLIKIRNLLKNNKFEDLEIHKHYWLNGIEGIPRHGYSLDELEKLFNKTEMITHGFKRRFIEGFGYTLIYKISKNISIKVCYFLDEIPIKVFNAIPINRNLEKAVPRRYGLRI